MPVDIFELYKDLKMDGVIFCFCGSTSQGIVEGIGETLRQRMQLEGVGTSVINKVFAIFVEQIQNILRYSDEKIPEEESTADELRFGIVMVGQQDGRYYVRCGNYIANSCAGSLSQLLEQLQKMDKDELKAFYKQRRRSTDVGNSKGAGLGFVEMARWAAEPFQFHITQVDEKRSFFSMTTVI